MTKKGDAKGFNYACFISYRRGGGQRNPYTRIFLEKLKKNLTYELYPYLEDDINQIYIDEDEINPGDLFNRNIAESLCRSVCMICILIPRYFSQSSLYCTKEFIGMEKIERSRFKQLNHSNPDKGYIIPLVLGDLERIPKSISSNRQCVNFTDIIHDGKGDLNIDMSKFMNTIRAIAKHIDARYRELTKLEDPCCSCTSFHLPPDEEALSWLMDYDIY